LVALHLFNKDKHYLIKDGKIQIIDEYTGGSARPLLGAGPASAYRDQGDCKVTRHKETRARISYQRFFRRYLRLAGMTGPPGKWPGNYGPSIACPW
jgi:preprotein translocase subunit SecA